MEDETTGEDTGDSTESEKKNLITIEEVRDKWDEIIQKIKHKKITIGSFLQEGELSRVDMNTIEIGFGPSNGFHIDAIMRSKELVLEVFKEVTGLDVKFRCEKMDIPQRKIASSKEERMDRLKTLGEKEPIIQKIVDDFEAEIIE